MSNSSVSQNEMVVFTMVCGQLVSDISRHWLVYVTTSRTLKYDLERRLH